MKSGTDPIQQADKSSRPIASFPRVVFSCLLFLTVWIAVAGVVGLLMALIFPRPGNAIEGGVGLDWRNLPGTILGFFIACRTWRVMIDRHVERFTHKPK